MGAHPSAVGQNHSLDVGLGVASIEYLERQHYMGLNMRARTTSLVAAKQGMDRVAIDLVIDSTRTGLFPAARPSMVYPMPFAQG